MSAKALRVFFASIFIAILIIAVIFHTGVHLPKSQVIVPQILPVSSIHPPLVVKSTFPFQKTNVTIISEVNGSVLEGARTQDKSVTIIGNVSDTLWITRSYQAMIEDPEQDEVYRDLILRFREVKNELHLTDDEYLELIAVYVQSLRYETSENTPVKFPVETVADGAGDCDDKSLLLAGLLSREGYGVALFSFGPERHMAIGIRSDNHSYQNTSYAFLETTNVSYIGLPPERLGTETPLTSVPMVIPIGDGILSYASTAQTQYIDTVKRESESRAKELEPQVRYLHADLKEREQEIVKMETRMMALQEAGSMQEYNSLVEEHNEKVAGYNRDLEKYRQIKSRYNKYAELHNHIIAHPFDREGVYGYIAENLPYGIFPSSG